MTHRLLTIVTLSISLASPAWSLSCLPPDTVRLYETARDANEGFWIVRGRIFAETPIAMPEAGSSGGYGESASASTPVRFTGLGLTSDGTYKGFAQDITLTISCFANWCGSAPYDEEVFAAIEVKDSGPELVIDPCSSRMVPYSEEAEERLVDCVRDGNCSQG